MIDTKGQMLLRLAELRQMLGEAAAREASLTILHLRKMIAKTEDELRELVERERASKADVACRSLHEHQ